MKTALLFLCMLTSLPSAQAQPSARIISPEVQVDGHVVFRFADPNALKVAVSIEGQSEPLPMQKDNNGTWTVTAGPLPPDFYGYNFVADGISLIDPSNPLLKPNLLNIENQVHIPDPTLPWEMTDVPHGEIHHHFYHSKIADDDRDFYVYTPPGYDPHAKTRYPVLYLLHGYSDDASAWTAVGRANFILDNLIAQGKARPMIVVMPLGYGDMEAIRLGEFRKNTDVTLRNLSRFTDVLLDEIIPQVEASYPVQKDSKSRAIAGLSMGGAESLLTGLNHTAQFGWVGAFSSGALDLRPYNVAFPNLDTTTNKQIQLLWIACGTEDDLIKENRKFKLWLKDKGVQFTDIETPGMHTWMVWRRNLVAFVPLLFQTR